MLHMIVQWTKMALVLVSAFGYWEYFRSEHKVNIYFAPFLTISVQFSVLFVAGLLNCLKEAAWILHGLGFLLCLLQAQKKKLCTFAPYGNAGYLWFFLAFFVIGFAVRNKMFTQIDNFTHWGTVVRNMLHTNRFPTFQDSVVEFISYPLGSSAMIYFLCKMAGGAEQVLMWAQAYLMLCALLPVFWCCPRQKGSCLAVSIVMAGFLLNYNIPVTELLVDTLMPMSGMATALFIYSHCRHQEEEGKTFPYYAVPMLVFSMNIKIAALIFVAFDLVLLYLCIRKKAGGRKQWSLITGTVLFANLLWNRHCAYVFQGASFSRHSVSLNWFQKILGDKDMEGILNTVKMVLTAVVTRTECIWLAVWFLFLGVLVWFAARERKKQYLLFLLSGVSLYLVYAAGILGMYVFSMEDSEELLAFTRYMRSVDIAIYYLLMVFSGLMLSDFGKKQWAAVASLILVLLTAAGWRFQTGKYLKEQLARCSEEWRQDLEYPITKYGIRREDKCLLCIREDHHGWPRRIWRYNLGSATVDHVVVEDAVQLEIAKNYDYVVIFDDGNSVIEDWVQENYPNAQGRRVIEP